MLSPKEAQVVLLDIIELAADNSDILLEDFSLERRGPLSIIFMSARCDDLFFWAYSDSELINTPCAVADLEQAYKEAGTWGNLLYAARRRKMRPQGAYFQYIDKKYHKVFKDCGPERKVCTGNPKEI